jgi:hypothetical protein
MILNSPGKIFELLLDFVKYVWVKLGLMFGSPYFDVLVLPLGISAELQVSIVNI